MIGFMKSLSLDHIKKLHQKKYRSEYQAVLVEGEHLISELEKSSFTDCEIIHTDKFNPNSRFKTRLIDKKQFKKISDVTSPQGIAALIPFRNFQTESTDKILFLDEVQDPGNLGTIIRSLAWFGGFQLWLSRGSVDPLNSKVIRSSMGAIYHLPIRQDVDVETLLNSTKSIGFLDLGGEAISSNSFKTHDCYIFGNEARGISSEIKEHSNSKAYTIGGNGTLESLNLATAVNIAVYEINR
jgi:TrmH family RNA methyltransferase